MSYTANICPQNLDRGILDLFSCLHVMEAVIKPEGRRPGFFNSFPNQRQLANICEMTVFLCSIHCYLYKWRGCCKISVKLCSTCHLSLVASISVQQLGAVCVSIFILFRLKYSYCVHTLQFLCSAWILYTATCSSRFVLPTSIEAVPFFELL